MQFFFLFSLFSFMPHPERFMTMCYNRFVQKSPLNLL